MSSLSLVLPCYNEELSLPQLVNRAIVCARKRKMAPSQFRLILVENGSSDNSLKVMEELKEKEDGAYIDIVKVFPNEGYGNGIFRGLKITNTDFVAWTHADEQCDPEDVFLAWEKLQQEDELTIFKGKREGRAFSEKFVSRGFEWVARVILSIKLSEINAQPKVFPRKLIAELNNPPKDFAFDLYVLLRGLNKGYTIKEIEVLFPPRVHGESNWSSTFSSKF
ncbi:MAG: glycosyltransferase family 2 protein, partial [Bdellovibrionales bacterium]|nr:glycosyltransferase family 2 protein [Bdellovibrionales bacterium]